MNHDAYFMSRALKLARQQTGRTGEAPSVGCVIIDRYGNAIAEAATGDGGTPAATDIALSRLTAEDTRGATVYLTLEPCADRSTAAPPCVESLISARIRRVVIAALHPASSSPSAAEALAAAGVNVDHGLLQSDAHNVYRDLFTTAPG